jgi:hypothetical protein
MESAQRHRHRFFQFGQLIILLINLQYWYASAIAAKQGKPRYVENLVRFHQCSVLLLPCVNHIHGILALAKNFFNGSQRQIDFWNRLRILQPMSPVSSDLAHGFGHPIDNPG